MEWQHYWGVAKNPSSLQELLEEGRGVETVGSSSAVLLQIGKGPSVNRKVTKGASLLTYLHGMYLTSLGSLLCLRFMSLSYKLCNVTHVAKLGH